MPSACKFSLLLQPETTLSNKFAPPIISLLKISANVVETVRPGSSPADARAPSAKAMWCARSRRPTMLVTACLRRRRLARITLRRTATIRTSRSRPLKPVMILPPLLFLSLLLRPRLLALLTMTSTLMLKVDGVMTAATTTKIEDGTGGQTEVESAVAVVRVLVVGCGICGRWYGGALRH